MMERYFFAVGNAHNNNVFVYIALSLHFHLNFITKKPHYYRNEF